MPKPKRFRKFLIIGLLLLIVAAGVGWKVVKGKDPILSIQTERVARRNITEAVLANGKIQPVLQVVINPEVSGEITSLPVKEGQRVKKGELLLKIKPDVYMAERNSAEARFKAAKAGKTLAAANLSKAKKDLIRVKELSSNKFVSEAALLDAETLYEVAKAQFETSMHQEDVAKAALDRADEDLSKTTISSPIDGTVTKLKSQPGERVVGTAMMAGTEIMTIADLKDMEARVEIGEIDIVFIQNGQTARLEVDAFRDRKFSGQVYEIANAAKTTAANTQQEATKFEVKIRVTDREEFRPGMSVTAYIETRTRTNVIAVPIQSVTTRVPGQKQNEKPKPRGKEEDEGVALAQPGKKKEALVKPAEVVFLHEGDHAKMAVVKRGIGDDDYVEITEGLSENQVVISGGAKVINRDLEDGKKVKIEQAGAAKKDPKST